MGTVIKGKPVADKITDSLREELRGFEKLTKIPRLGILRVGERPEDLAYERGATNRCKKIGIDVEVKTLPMDVTQEVFIEELKAYNTDSKINGILVFRPLPEQINEEVIKYVIAPEKDIDCFSPVNVGKMVEGDPSGFPPCTPTAVIEILEHYDVQVEGSDCTVIGASMVVGKPAALLLMNKKGTVTVAHSKTKDTKAVAENAEILVVAVGRGKMVKKDWVSDGAVVIDVGINEDEDGSLCGDVDFEQVKEKASKITPVPAGVGSVTTSILAKHVVKAFKKQHQIE